MTIAPSRALDREATIKPAVYVGPARRLLPAELAESLIRVTVDVSLGLPGMFELVFDDRGRSDRLLTELAIGTELGVAAASPVRVGDPRMLIVGEVTAHEAEYAETASIVVRGYTQDHRLQRLRRTRTFQNVSDADIARKVARDNNLRIGEITVGGPVHEHVGQVNQTDWDFLIGRAAAIGYQVGVSQGEFFFRERAPGGPVSLILRANLLTFSPRITAGNLAPEAEVRVWDPLAGAVVSEVVKLGAPQPGTAQVAGADLQATLAKVSTSTPPAGTATPGSVGPKPSERATVLHDRSVSTGPGARAALRKQAQGLAGELAETFAEAVGESIGDPWLSAGRTVTVSGVAAPFAGQWTLTRARHEIDYGRYRTRFEVSGRHDRTLLGLTAGPARTDDRVHGVVCGIVSNTGDPLGKGRVKVILPWLSPEYESNWACVVQPGAGARSGALFLPEPEDEVMVGFEYGDLQRPYVLGGIINNRSTYTLGAPAVQARGASSAVHWRGLVAPSGNRLAFHDEVVGPGRVDQAEILLGSGDGNLTLRIDQVAGAVQLRCLPGQATRPGEKGRLAIECGPGGTIGIVAGSGGSITVDGGAELTLKAQQLNLEGARISVNATGPVEVKGRPVKLN